MTEKAGKIHLLFVVQYQSSNIFTPNYLKIISAGTQNVTSNWCRTNNTFENGYQKVGAKIIHFFVIHFQ
jgi:hypothetical protein